MNASNKLPDRPNDKAPVSGILVVDKPVGPTSMGAITIVRRATGVRKVGHAGTLDPMASGILIIAIGMATKSLHHFMHATKRYRTVIDLSAVSQTDDLESEPVPVDVPVHPTSEIITNILRTFTGAIEQTPPAHSAVSVGGFRAYELARQGIHIPLASRTVHVHDLKIIKYVWPTLEIELTSSKGLYVRSLARDVGKALGTGGYCAALRRTAVGPFDESTAVKLSDIHDRLDDKYLLPLDRALQMVREHKE